MDMPFASMLERDITNSMQRRSSRRPLADALFRSPGGVWIYGAGGFGRSVAKELIAKQVVVAGFIDRALAGGLIDGRPVLHPAHERLPAGATVLLGLFNPLHPWSEAMEAARCAGASEVFTPVEIVDLLPELSNYWLVPSTVVRSQIPELAAVADLFADSRSVAILRDLLLFRLTGDPAMHPPVDADDQYLAADLRREGLQFNHPIAFLDGGAFSGDTGLFLNRNGVELAEWVAFEPDAANFAQLAAAGQSLRSTRRSFFPLGLSDRLENVSFASGGGASSHLGGDGGRLRVVAADEVLGGFKPDYVKLDIEGAEAAALRGMTQLIDAARPKLAVCVYHRPLDITTLPRQVRACLPEAKLYLRQHAYNGFDTVLYAIP
jgi:FkbM family methyltransferase